MSAPPAFPARELEERPQVVDVGVHAAVGDESEQVHPPPRCFARRNAPRSASFSENDPSSIARFTRTRSW